MMDFFKITCVYVFVCVSVCLASESIDIFSEDTLDRSSRALSVNVDNYCEGVFGQGSYLCRDNYNTGYGYLCASLYCFDKRTRQCAFSIAPQDSTLCGNGKWCSAGQCTRDSNALQTSDECPLGDTLKQDVFLGKNCSQIARDRPSLCNDDKISKIWCCESCSNLTSTDPANFTGPAKSADKDCKDTYGADSYFCMSDSRYNNTYGDYMCLNQYCYDSSSGKCVSVSADDGVPCGNGQWCVGGKCIQSASAPADPKSECLYGSQYQTFCSNNIKYPDIARYCSNPTYESGCCSFCLQHKNTSRPSGCEYGDSKPDVCQAQVTAGTIKSYCLNNKDDCCETCSSLQNSTDPNCPYGDVDTQKCAQLMLDNIGPGNCYNVRHKQECCESCAEYYNASISGCEYGDHWKDYCANNIVPPHVANSCNQYHYQCCATCNKYEEEGFPGCKYGDRDPNYCEGLMNSTKGTAHCYDFDTQSSCCGTCHKLKDESTPSCLYGDTNPSECKKLMNDSYGLGNCYDIKGKISCCRTCAENRNDTNKGCEFGDHWRDYCSKNIVSNTTAWLCFQHERDCCETCAEYKLSDLDDCKYGDKNPINCNFMIPDEATAAWRCSSLANQCCETCSRFGHPGIEGGIHFVG